MNGELKACPLCGKQPTVGDATPNVPGMEDCGYSYVECCFIHVHSSEGPEHAAEIWNTRPTPAPGALPELPGSNLAEDIIEAVCDELGIGELARCKSVILTNVRNLTRRADCLREIEREFFTETAFDDDGDEYAECQLPWGAGADEYVKTFDVALSSKLRAYAEQCRAGVWLPIETLEEGVEALLFCEDYAPHFFVGSYTMRSRHEDVLVSEKGRRRTYEWTELKERDWGDAPSYGATHWQSLPAPPALQSAFADDEGVK